MKGKVSEMEEKDVFKFYQDAEGEWRWHRIAPNGEIVGATTEGYKNLYEAEENAKRNGWEGDGDGKETT
jgi:uncharacterized protein YegP (UPF0339 family)